MNLDEPSDASPCRCDFCARKKRHGDNWCPACGEVRMHPPKRWEDMDVCDECDRSMATGRPIHVPIFTNEQRAMLLALIPLASLDRGRGGS